MTRWLLACIITPASVCDQHTSGPTYPLKRTVTLAGQIIRYRLERSHESDSPQPVAVQIADSTVAGEVIWRRYPTKENWTGFPFSMDLTDNRTLIAFWGWIATAFAVEWNRQSKLWVLLAAFTLLGVYGMPHSLFGWELKY